jgi:transposase InsO family protein
MGGLYCQDNDIPLFTLPVRSPKLNGCVERAQRTNTEEFYECAETQYNLESVQSQLRDWEVEYNSVGPRQTLGYLTPNEWLAAQNNSIQEGM